MLFENRIKQPRILTAVSLLCLAIAFLLRCFVHPSADVALYLMEGLQGLLIGMALVSGLKSASVRIKRTPGANSALLPRPELPAAIIAIGMLLMAIAVASLKFLRPSAHFGPDLVDEFHGVLFGVSIGMTCVGVALGALRLRRCQ